jgi:TerC family integral membrane protein
VMTSVSLFPFAEYWWFYAGFSMFVMLLLVLDLGVFHRESRSMSFREAAAWAVGWVLLALGFAALLYLYALWQFPRDQRLSALPGFDPAAAAKQVTLEFLAGYLVEESLSVDNLFVFVLIFSHLGIPTKLQYRVLFYGILGALLFRGGFIALGSVLMQSHWIVLVFGAFLIFTGVKMVVSGDLQRSPEGHPLIRLCRRLLPVTRELHGERFLVRQDGVLHATPLFIALLVVDVADVIFAMDSVPAIYALTGEPLIVFTSNAFAVLGLRSIYFLLAGALDRFHMLRHGLAVLLIFVGLKMAWLDGWFGGKFPIALSLGIICGVILGSILLSLWLPSAPRPKSASID